MAGLLNQTTSLMMYARAGTNITSGREISNSLLLMKTAQISTDVNQIKNSSREALAAQYRGNDLLERSNNLAAQNTQALVDGFDSVNDNFTRNIAELSNQVCWKLDQQLVSMQENHQETLTAIDNVSKEISQLTAIAQEQLKTAKEQVSLQKRSNIIVSNPDQTRAEEIFNKGKKRIRTLSLLSTVDEQRKEVFSALEEYKKSVEIDPFNEQALLQLAVWTRYINEASDDWIQYFREAKNRALVERENDDEYQRTIALLTIESLSYSAAICLIDSSKYEIYLNEFQEFCEANSKNLAYEARLTIFAMAIIAKIKITSKVSEIEKTSAAAYAEFGVKSVLDELLKCEEISSDNLFIEFARETCLGLNKKMAYAMNAVSEGLK